MENQNAYFGRMLAAASADILGGSKSIATVISDVHEALVFLRDKVPGSCFTFMPPHRNAATNKVEFETAAGLIAIGTGEEEIHRIIEFYPRDCPEPKAAIHIFLDGYKERRDTIVIGIYEAAIRQGLVPPEYESGERIYPPEGNP